MIDLSEAAAARIRAVIAEAVPPEDYGLRIKVVGGGCAGLTYDLYFDRARPGDVERSSRGVRVLVDPRTARVITGTSVQWSAGPEGGFSFANPNARNHCSCAASFGIW